MEYMDSDSKGKKPAPILLIHSFYKDLDPIISPSLRVVDAVKAAVIQGIIAPGESIPSTTALAQQLGVNPMTTIKSLQKVASFGIIERVRGSKYIVCEKGPEIASEMIEGEILIDLRYLHRKMNHYKIPRSQVIQWLKGFADADESIEKATKETVCGIAPK